MSQLTEDRLRAAFSARADLVQRNQLTPAEVPAAAGNGDRRWATPLSVAAAVAAVTVGAVVASQLGDPSGPVPAVPAVSPAPSTVQTTPPTTPTTPPTTAPPSTATAKPPVATRTVPVLGLSVSLPATWSARETEGATACLSPTPLTAKQCLEQRTGPALSEGVITVVRRRAGEDRLDPAAPFGGAAECTASTLRSRDTVELASTTASYARFDCTGEATVQQWVLDGERVVIWHMLPKDNAVAQAAARSVKVLKDLPAAPVTETETGMKVNGDLPLTELPRGKDTALPYVVGGVLHDGDRRIDLGKNGTVGGLARVPDGYIAGTFDPSGGSRLLLRIAFDGTVQRIADADADGYLSFAVSPDRRRVAWTEIPADRSASVLHVADTTNGRETGTKAVDFPAQVRDWSGAGVLVADRSDKWTGRLWNPATDELTKLPAGAPTFANDAAGTIAVVDFQEGSSDQLCGAVVGADDPTQALWRSCERAAGADFSPDGRTALLYHSMTDGEGPLAYYIADAATGRIAVTLGGDFESDLVWEDDTHFVFSLAEGKQEALVRCSTAGYCERVSDFQPVSGNGYGEPAYLVGRR